MLSLPCRLHVARTYTTIFFWAERKEFTLQYVCICMTVMFKVYVKRFRHNISIEKEHNSFELLFGSDRERIKSLTGLWSGKSHLKLHIIIINFKR